MQQFRRNIFALHSLSGQSILDVTLQAGLSVLKNYGCGEVGLVQGREIPRFLRLVLSLTHTRCAGLGAQLGLPRLCRSHDDARHRSPFLKPHKLSARVLDVWRAHERGQPANGSTQRQRVRDAFPAPRTPCFHSTSRGLCCRYCRNALEAMAAERDGMITCPRTNRVYAFSKAQKVYIM